MSNDSSLPMRCFVVMGFGTKTDYATGRKLDLNKSYRLLIKPVIESRGIHCTRADEMRFSGSIDMHMYRELLRADIVIADLSTANNNAFYELGIRHALRPYRTIVISEDKLSYPFDLNHIKITSYTHLGDAIDFEEVERFRNRLGELVDEVLAKEEPDSPVYTYLDRLIPPSINDRNEESHTEQPVMVPAGPPESPYGKALSIVVEEGEEAIESSDFVNARELFESALLIGRNSVGRNTPNDPYIVQRLALATYKTQLPDKVSALKDALVILAQLDLAHTNDPETVSLAGAIEKKLYEEGQGERHLSNAIEFHQRGYFLLNNRYNAINLAFTLNYRADSALCQTKEEQIADMVYANYTRQRVLTLCAKDWDKIVKLETAGHLHERTNGDRALRESYYNEQKFWILINRAEAYYGLGNFPAYRDAIREAEKTEHADWMMQSLNQQLAKLRRLLLAKGHLLNPKWIEEKEPALA